MANRNRAWVDSIFTGSQIPDGTSTHTNLLVDAPTVDTLTVVRIIVDIVVAHGVDETGDMSNAVHLGIGVSSVEAFEAIPPVLPSPEVFTEYPPRGWLYVATLPVFSTQITVGYARTAVRFVADFGAMRKIDKGILFMSVANDGIFTKSDVDLWGRVRVLCLT